ncbi:nucleotidyltransferase family protein [Nitratireductor mangrovi]|uniref:Nucleotidyltransferase family protein n=1 Tax=Nitratireductor mangrovi TaxID=2599600 RepID=A0A5B8L566_9HYPH|nr:nucleotidyltransferase family protein [Nitratireductor mangrovi]QDZ03186.1 nucleotidyltransferase family protein [Nitratireductor mangrovi]
MVLAAGLGLRMRPITETLPKPLVRVGGKPLLDWGLDALAAAGVERAVVNVHHLAGQVVDHLSPRRSPAIVISDETPRLLDSAGGIVKALPHLGGQPFFVVNADTFWIDAGDPGLVSLAAHWDTARMDILLMLVDLASTTGHNGKTDFQVDGDGRLSRAAGAADGLVYAGAAIIHPRVFVDAHPEPHSLNRYFDDTIASGRLFGHRMTGRWITVGTPDAIPLAEAAVEAAMAGAP